MYGYIYVTTNKTNNKKYIGRHKSIQFDPTYYGSGKIITNAIKKYGLENFEVEILNAINSVPTICESFEELCQSESYYIDYYDCVMSANYYNLIPGGLGGSVKGSIGIHSSSGDYKFVLPDELEDFLCQGYTIGGPSQSKDAVEARRKSNTGKKRSVESRKRMSEAQQGHYVSEETRLKYSQAHKGKPNKNKGKVAMLNERTDEQIYAYPSEVAFYHSLGFEQRAKSHLKEDSKQKHREAKLNTTLVHNGVIEKCIKAYELDEYLAQGWIHGKLPQHIIKPNKGKKLLYLDGRRKYVDPKDVDYLLSIGYTTKIK